MVQHPALRPRSPRPGYGTINPFDHGIRPPLAHDTLIPFDHDIESQDEQLDPTSSSLTCRYPVSIVFVYDIVVVCVFIAILVAMYTMGYLEMQKKG